MHLYFIRIKTYVQKEKMRMYSDIISIQYNVEIDHRVMINVRYEFVHITVHHF